MSRCDLNPTCSSLRRLLREMGCPPEDISPECSQDGICRGVFDNAHQADRLLNIDNVKAVEHFLLKVYGELPIERSPAVAKQIFSRGPFVCPEIDIEIRQPCQIRSCAYWTEHAWTRNCILYYRVDQHRESLDTKDLTFLLGPSSSDIRKQTNRVIADLRRLALHHKTAQESEQPDLPGEDNCVVCGDELAEQFITKQGCRYCSTDCLEIKPPIDFRIEHEFNLSIVRVLEICIDSFAAKRPICHALNVTTKQLDDLCDRYEIDLSVLSK